MKILVPAAVVTANDHWEGELLHEFNTDFGSSQKDRNK